MHVLSPGELNAYDVLVNDHVVFTTATLPVATPAATQLVSAPAVVADEDETGEEE